MYLGMVMVLTGVSSYMRFGDCIYRAVGLPGDISSDIYSSGGKKYAGSIRGSISDLQEKSPYVDIN